MLVPGYERGYLKNAMQLESFSSTNRSWSMRHYLTRLVSVCIREVYASVAKLMELRCTDVKQGSHRHHLFLWCSCFSAHFPNVARLFRSSTVLITMLLFFCIMVALQGHNRDQGPTVLSVVCTQSKRKSRPPKSLYSKAWSTLDN